MAFSALDFSSRSSPRSSIEDRRLSQTARDRQGTVFHILLPEPVATKWHFYAHALRSETVVRYGFDW